MQALTTTIFPCYAAADREMARRLAGFLERGADVRVFLEEGEMRPGEDLVRKAREGRTADLVLVLFSRDSLPPRWPRAQWEDALVNEPREEGVRIGFLRCDDCAPPKVLAPLFDLSMSESNGSRQVKRWIRTGRTEPAVRALGLEALGVAIADRPGAETTDDAALALEFARAFRDDFDEVLVLDCGGRSGAAVAGDLGSRLGLRLEGPLESNLERLREFCEPRRFLLVIEGGCDPLIFEGRCSTLTAPVREAAAPATEIEEAQRVLTECTADWPEICRHARNGRRLLSGAGRTAELYELMQQWHDAAEARNNRHALDESARELAWILQGWGFLDDARRWEEWRTREYADQMTLPFG